jgi:hypothetical protein
VGCPHRGHAGTHTDALRGDLRPGVDEPADTMIRTEDDPKVPVEPCAAEVPHRVASPLKPLTGAQPEALERRPATVLQDPSLGLPQAHARHP